MRTKSILLITPLLVLLLSCGADHMTEQPRETILVKIAGKTISRNEFIRRAEFTMRPAYCSSSHMVDKKIVLNSLIAEKLFALEARDSNELLDLERVQAFLRGRKEQAMRQWLYKVEAHDKVVLDSTMIKKVFKTAGRTYNISYFSNPDSFAVLHFCEMLHNRNVTFEQAFFNLTSLDTLPQREVAWSSAEHDVILDSLFLYPLAPGQIIGPVKIKDQFIMIKILGWTETPAVTASQVEQRWHKITEEYSERRAVLLWERHIRTVMKGKRIEFHPDTFFKVTNLLGPIYIKSSSERKELFSKSYWNQESTAEDYQTLQTEMKQLYQQPFFKVNEQIWTVKDFVDELAVHPLVFRNTPLENGDFGQQLQFAVMDLVRDRYLTENAYKRHYDKINVIQRNVNMWKDNLGYQFFKQRLIEKNRLDSLNQDAPGLLVEQFLNAKVDSLQKNYSDSIYFNIDAFEDIQLTRIHMTALQKDQPYIQVVPSFPVVTTDSRLDYGRRM